MNKICHAFRWFTKNTPQLLVIYHPSYAGESRSIAQKVLKRIWVTNIRTPIEWVSWDPKIDNTALAILIDRIVVIAAIDGFQEESQSDFLHKLKIHGNILRQDIYHEIQPPLQWKHLLCDFSSVAQSREQRCQIWSGKVQLSSSFEWVKTSWVTRVSSATFGTSWTRKRFGIQCTKLFYRKQMYLNFEPREGNSKTVYY